MASTTDSLLRPARSCRAEAVNRWESLSDRAQVRLKLAVVVVCILAAFHYSLLSLLQTVGFDTPLAYVGLVPLLAAGLAWLHRAPAVSEPNIHDRQLDYIIGVPLLAVAALMTLGLPARMGDMYWVDRIDLLTLPIFTAGVVALVFGTRVLWRQKLAIAYLFFAWPWPYTAVLLGSLDGFTNITVGALNTVLRVIPVARIVPGSGNQGLYEIVHQGHIFPVSVITACSGVDGMVGFLLVGSGLATIVGGPLVRKGLWLLTGLVLLWSTNLLRLVVIFALGQWFGEHLAIGIVHPVLGVVVFCLGVVVMTRLVGPFGLRLLDAGPKRAAPDALAAARTGAPRVFLAAGLVLALGAALFAQNSSLRGYDLVASASGEPELGAFIASPATPNGWEASYEATYTMNKPLFGESSVWFRYLYTPTGGLSDLHSSLPVTADVIDAPGLGDFEEYGVEDCYTFHGYVLADVAKVKLGDGINGQALSYSSSVMDQDWSIVYWIWPVKTATGTRYERIILYLQNTAGAVVRPPAHVPGVSGLPGALVASNPQDRRLMTNRLFLVAFAREIVAGQVKRTDTDVDIATLQPSEILTANPSTTP